MATASVPTSRPELIDWVLEIAADEPDGDHYLSHLVMARKVLRCSPAEAVRIARGFAHRRLTRDECEGLVADWQEEGWAVPAGHRGAHR